MNVNDVRFDKASPWLRAEAAAILGFAVWLYLHAHGSVLAGVLLFLLPDLTMLGYLAGPRTGARIYNLGHAYFVPAVLCAGQFFVTRTASWLWLIWVAHIALDRLLGYGLKLPDGFGFTHLGSVGPLKARSLEES